MRNIVGTSSYGKALANYYFFNGATAYWLAGWRDEHVIQASIARLHKLEINRMRVTIAGRTNLFYGEPVMTGPNWTLFSNTMAGTSS